jgi:hypothetical protein
MSQPAPPKTAMKTAAEICAQYEPGDEAKARLQEGMTPRQFLDRLVAEGHPADAARFLAHALTKREAVWWAGLCVGQALGPKPPAPALAALEAAKAWVVEPSDANRRAALPAAEAAGAGTAAGCLAMAAYFTGGSLAPADLPVVPPPEHLAADVASTALALAAALAPEKTGESYAAFLQLGFDVANRKNLWIEVKN